MVEQFDRDQDRYKSKDFNETQLRTHFINPFFEALGWDMHPKGSPDKWEVIEEDKVVVKGQLVNPDYGFRLNEKKKFFVEVKRPYVNIESGISPAYQLRRYGWSSNLSVSILTDFEEFSVYFCGSRPFQDDKATKGRLFYFRYDQYDEKWDQIASKFSREAVLGGSLEKIVENIRKTKGDIPVNAALLDDISKWRDMLARNIALRNASISQQNLNFAVQRIIDRILFLRICEDRAIEEEGRLRSLAEGKDIHSGLVELFKEADHRYNSGIFYFKEEKDRKEEPDRITPGLSIDDQVLKEIIDNLYYPNSPYVFSKIPAEILGQVYEQFLGKVIRLTEGHHAKVEDKPEVRKAGGVYYTPSYIVDYIVKKTVGKLLEGKTPADAAALRILDPACGSGSFLIGAYQYLLDWHKEWYISNLVPVLEKTKSPTDPGVLKLLPESLEKPNRARSRRIWARAAEAMIPVEKDGNDSWRLTTSERKRILLNNIYGIDIDFQAVEVTKLSLLLKVLEGETKETISNLQRFFKERALPDLGENIKCGNSLIGYDYYDDNLHLSEEEAKRINAFDWKTGFPEVFERGGFDAVVGNPPYIRIQTMKEWAPLEVEHYKQKYVSANKGNYDIYVVFVERGLDLLNERGRLGFILPHKFFNAQYGKPLRELLVNDKLISEIVHFGDLQVFSGAMTYTCLLFLDKSSLDDFQLFRVEDLAKWCNKDEAVFGSISFESIKDEEWNLTVGKTAPIFQKLSRCPRKLGDIADKIFQGLVTGADPVFILKNADGNQYFSEATQKIYSLEKDLLHPLCKGSVNLRRYHVTDLTKSIIFPYKLIEGKAILFSEMELEEKYPLTYRYLIENRTMLESRERGKWKNNRWYAFGRSQNLNQMEQIKILTPSIANSASFSLDSENYYYFVGSGGGGGGGYGITLKQEDQIEYNYLLGLLNSNLLDVYLKSFSSRFSGGYYAYNRQYIEMLPIRTIDFSDPTDVALHDRMVALVQSMLDLHKQLASATGEHERTMLHRRIEATDLQIDRLVYELYDLTKDEIAIVEEK